MKSLVSFFVKHSLTLNLFVVLMLGASVYRAVNMNLEAFPAVNFDIVSVATTYPGASAREVEQYVTDPLEDEIETVSGLNEVVSTSVEGLSIIIVKLDPDLPERKKSATVNDIQRAVDRVRDLPDEVEDAPVVDELESGDMPVVELGLSGDIPYAALHKIADELSEEIKKIPDASGVELNGFRKKEFWVEVDPRRLTRHYVSLADITRSLAANNLTLPGGDLETKDEAFLVRTIGETNTAKRIENLVLRTNDSGIRVRVRDVAKVKETFEEQDKLFRVSGEPSINLSIQKKPSGDIIRLIKASRKLVEEYKETSPYGDKLKTSFVNDMSHFVERWLGVLLNNGVFGIGMVLISLLLLLSPGIAMVAAAGMPVAFLGAILVMSYTGLTINLITMFALVIVLGMLVDDAIIVAENIWHHYEDGATALDATIKGTTEVFWPVTATILTTVAAFSPMLLVAGIFGKFISSMPKVVIVALFISLLEAMIILPAHAKDVIGIREWVRRKLGRKSDRGTKIKKGPIARGLDWLIGVYGGVLTATLKIRYIFIALIVASLAGTIWFAKAKMQFILFPTEGVEAFFVRGELPTGTALQETSKKLVAFEQVIRENIAEAELNDFVTLIGVHENDAGDPLKTRGTNLGQVGVYLVPEIERSRSADQIIEDLRGPINAAATKHGFVRTTFTTIRRGPPVGKPVAVRIAGPDLDTLESLSDRVQGLLGEIPGVADITENFKEGKGEIQVNVDQDAATKALVSVRDIALHVRAMLEGSVATYVRKEGDRIAVRVRYKKSQRSRLSAIGKSFLTNAAGIRIPLNSVVDINRARGISAIIHRDGVRTITVTTAINESMTSSSEVNEELDTRLESMRKEFPGYTFSLGGEYEDTNESLDSLAFAFLVALALIYLILATQFKSMTQPFVIMAAIPFGLIGVIFAFYFHQLHLSFLGMIGMIGLTGVVINDSIVLVDFINKARERGMTAFEASVYAGKRRFRAVWLTSITTIFGLLPMVYGIGGLDHFLRPAAVALGYGLIFATVLILLFVPCLYMLRHDITTIPGRVGRFTGIVK